MSRKTKSHLEETMAAMIVQAGIPEPEREAKIVPGRRFRADFCWPRQQLILEVEGGTWSGGRHTTGAGFRADCIKYHLMQQQGYRVIRVTGDMVEDGTALAMLVEAFAWGTR